MQYPTFALQSVRFATEFATSTYATLQTTETRIRPTVEAHALTTWQVASSPRALALYRFLWRLFLAIGAVLIYASFTLGQMFRELCDRLVEESLRPEPQSQSESMPEVEGESETAPIQPETELGDVVVEPVPPIATSLPPTPFITDSVSLLPPAKVDPQQEPVKPKRARTKASKTKKAA